MPGPAPKPNRVGHSPRAFDWVSLPIEGRKGAAPKLPALRRWSKLTVAAWEDWWSTPQAAAWDQSGRSLHRWAVLFDVMVTSDEPSAAIHVQMTAIEDRHGFTPAAMLKLRWRIVADEVGSQRESSSGKGAKSKRLRAV